MELDNLKCCGNCRKRNFSSDCPKQGECVKWKDIIGPHMYCDSWTYDHFEQKDRKI